MFVEVADVFAREGRRGAIEAHIAQSVEHFLGKEEVIGSIPVMGSTHNVYCTIRQV